MKKIPTLFTRVFENNKILTVTSEVISGCEWVLDGEGKATEKFDGTCTLMLDNWVWKRYDCKHGKPVPKGAILCQSAPDPITGHFPVWVRCSESNPADKWFITAFKNARNNYIVFPSNQTYELCGPHFRSNPHKLQEDTFIRHGSVVLDVPRDFEGIKKYLQEHYIEGIVFHRGNGEMCKIKRSDFGFDWNK